jgi:hypothetical protein
MSYRVQPVLRKVPLAPCAALAVGASALALVERLLQLEPPHQARLRGVATDDAVLVLGASDDLPWCEGIAYLGCEPETPELLLPCAVAANVPAPLLLRALKARFAAADLRAPCAIWLEPALVLSASTAQALDRARLLQWREQARERTGAP